jgi:hypothetical protein
MINRKILNNPYFTISQLIFFTKTKKSALVYISRWLKNKSIIKIRNWIYVNSEKFLELNLEWKSSGYFEFIATNLIYIPSYLSLEYVLYENNVLTENVYNFTLITTKKTASFKNSFWTFNYKSIKKEYFDNYDILDVDWFIIYKANLEKALFDYFYFKRWIIWEKSYFLELRLNLENINFVKFEKIINKYNNRKLKKVFKYLELIRNI